MKISDLYLFDRESNELVQAELHSGISRDQLKSWRKSWFRKRHRFSFEEDSSWDWRVLNQLALEDPNYRAFSIMCDSDVQGLMLLEMKFESRLPETYGDPIIHISRLSTAPWNRFSFTANPKYKGVGTAMIEFAILQSIQAGYDGKIGLHSLSNATGFYECLGMANLGVDEDMENLPYYEFSSSLAKAYLRSKR